MSAAVKVAVPEKDQEPRMADEATLAAARAITKNLTWDDLVRIANKPKRSGWVLWKSSGLVEQITPLPAKNKLLARAWKTSLRHALVRNPSDAEEYRCVEVDAETKRPVVLGSSESAM